MKLLQKGLLAASLAGALMFGAAGNVKAQFVVANPTSDLLTIQNRVTTAFSQFKNYQEYKTATDAVRALQKVSAAVKNSKKVMSCFTLMAKHKELYNNIWAAAAGDRKFNMNEKSSIRKNLDRYVDVALRNAEDLKQAIVEGNATMSDKERFDLIDLVYSRLSSTYNDMYSYSSSIRSVSINRAAEQYERANKIDGFYGTRQND